jgi:hypothetical protein
MASAGYAPKTMTTDAGKETAQGNPFVHSLPYETDASQSSGCFRLEASKSANRQNVERLIARFWEILRSSPDSE